MKPEEALDLLVGMYDFHLKFLQPLQIIYRVDNKSLRPGYVYRAVKHQKEMLLRMAKELESVEVEE